MVVGRWRVRGGRDCAAGDEIDWGGGGGGGV